MYNNIMGSRDMLDTLYLFQPRGPGTAFLFRMATPTSLVGRGNPRTGRPYGREIKEGLGGARLLNEARRLRDLRLGAIRQEEAAATGAWNGTMAQALDIAAALRAEEDEDKRDTAESVLADQAEQLEKRIGTKKAVRWFKTATGKQTPFATACERTATDQSTGPRPGTCT
jgi:hypothetical protein